MKRLGVDLGGRRVGLAWNDDPDVPARPLGTAAVRDEAGAVEAVALAAAREGAEELVVGLPLRLDGRDGTASRAARRVARALEARTGLVVTLWDERLTTAEAQRRRVSQGRKGREGIDAEAAAIILQSYVDAQRGGTGWQRDPDDG